MGNRNSIRKRKELEEIEDLPGRHNPDEGSSRTDIQAGNSTSISDWYDCVLKKLQEQYRTLSIRGLPWMQDVCIPLSDYQVKLIMLKQDANGTEVEEEIAELDKMFETVGETDKTPLRILVEGEPGYGKTILASKLCFDHACQMNYIKDYELVLYYPLSLFHGSLSGFFFRDLEGRVAKDTDVILSAMKNSSKKILIILDGLDEVPIHLMKPIVSLLTGESLPHLSIVVTSKPGIFNSRSWKSRKDGLSMTHSVDINWNIIWQNRVIIKGLSRNMQEELTQKQLVGFSERIKRNIMIQLRRLKKNKMLLPEFLECPLFLLMIILALTDKPDDNLRSLKTRTDLYKLVVNFAMNRYFNEAYRCMDVFSVSKGKKPDCAILFAQFGQFSIEALKLNKASFSKAEIVGNDNVRDARIIELGFLTHNNLPLSTERIQEKVTYEPIHKSILEFAAAFLLWIRYTEATMTEWKREIRSIASNQTFASSLIIPFLAGIMGESAGDLFIALQPYAVEYVNNWKGWLTACIPELILTQVVLSSLMPFLPNEWTKKWEDIILTGCPKREIILRHGVKNRRIQWITWRVGDSISFPCDVSVKKATLLATSRTSRNVIRFRCKHLVCVFSDSVFLPEFQNILSVLPAISYECISFTLGKRLDVAPIPTIFKAITTGKLKHDHVYVMKCHLENQLDQMRTLNNLIKEERVDVINLSIRSESEEACPSSTLSSYSPTDKQQELMNTLVNYAAGSSQLTSFLVDNITSINLAIDLNQLCAGGKKSWECLFLKGFEILQMHEINDEFMVKYLCISDSDISEPLVNFLCFCQVISLCCSLSFVRGILPLKFVHENLTELNIAIDESLFDIGFIPIPTQFVRLEILIMTMTHFKRQTRTPPLLDSLFGATHSLQLKGIEIWDVQRNRDLALELAKRILELLQGKTRQQSQPRGKYFSSKTIPSKPQNKLSLHYFLLQNGRGYFDVSCELLYKVKEALITNSLLQLDIVDELASFSSMQELFPPDEHFKIEQDLWGARVTDSIQSRVECDLLSTRRLQKRCSVVYAPKS